MADTAKKPRKPRTPAPIGETKSDKFARLAKARTARILASIKSLSKLSTSAYQRSDAQVEAIFDAITSATKDARASFAPRGSASQPSFDLPAFQPAEGETAEAA